MPIESQQHRTLTGLFHHVFMSFMARRARRAAAHFNASLKLPFVIRPSDFVLFFLTASLLLRCGDVEMNPGPDDEQKLDILSQQMQSVLSTVTNVSKQNDGIQRQMEVNHYSICQEVREIKAHLGYVIKAVKNNSDDIQKLHLRLQQTEQNVERLEHQLDRVQADMRRRNVKMSGLAEERRETPVSLLGRVSDVLGCYFRELGRPNDVIERAVRVGRSSNNYARPVIITFRRHEAAMAVMSDRQGRQAMAHDEGVRLAPDLTPRQRDEMQRLWNEGRRGYLRDGRVVAVPEYGQGGRGRREWRRRDSGRVDNASNSEHPERKQGSCAYADDVPPPNTTSGEGATYLSTTDNGPNGAPVGADHEAVVFDLELDIEVPQGGTNQTRPEDSSKGAVSTSPVVFTLGTAGASSERQASRGFGRGSPVSNLQQSHFGAATPGSSDRGDCGRGRGRSAHQPKVLALSRSAASPILTRSKSQNMRPAALCKDWQNFFDKSKKLPAPDTMETESATDTDNIWG